MTGITIIGIMHVDDIEIGIVDSCCGAMHAHFVGVGDIAFGVECCFGDIEERVY